MSKLIYLDLDEEITDVIDKISKVDDRSVSLVIPRGSTLANSIVNLKLLVKRSKSLKKDVALVTSDNIVHNLASQIGLSVFESIEDARAGKEEEPMEESKAEEPLSRGTEDEIDGIKVHKYDRDGREDMEPEEENAEEKISDESKLPSESGEGEIIEAVRDAEDENSNVGNGNQNEKELIKEADSHPEPISEPTAEKADYKLIKKPMKPEIRQRELPSPDLGGGQVFGKMRTAKSRKKKIIAIISGLIALLLIFGAYIALPKATVTLSVTSEPFSSAADIIVNKDATEINSETSTIPGKLVSEEEELTKPFAASGEKNIGAKAKGKITIYNYWDDKPHQIASGSKFSTSAGVVFVSTEAATVPAGHPNIIPPSTYEINPPGTVDVSVEAVDVGEKGNIGPSNFTITSLPSVQQSKIYGKSSTAMSGGTNEIVKVITDKDISDAKDSTENELKTTITDKIKSDLTDSEKLLDSAISMSVTSESASAKSGDQLDTFNYLAKIKIEAITFSEDNFKLLLLKTAQLQLPDDRQIVTNDNQNINYEVTGSDIAAGTVNLHGTFDGFIAKKYNTDEMKSAIRFISIRKATGKLTAYDGILSADISTSPRFLRSLPALAQRININFDYGTSKKSNISSQEQ